MENTIITAQFLNYLINNKTVAPVKDFSLDETYFPGYEKEFNFIVGYYHQSTLTDGIGVVPDAVKFSVQFPDFPLMETGPEINLMYKELHEAKCYSMFVGEMNRIGELSRNDSITAINEGKTAFENLSRFANVSGLGSGTNIYRQAGERLEDYIKRIEYQGLLGIKTGHSGLDEIVHGWLPEDFVVIIARTNEGKSWLLEEFTKQAAEQGKFVAVYSGEMSALMYGYRYDSLLGHFGNAQLISGNVMLGDQNIPEVGIKSMNEYKNYIAQMTNTQLPGVVVFTPKDFGGRMTTDHMHILQEKYGFDMWAIDQITLMEDCRKSRDPRIILSNISEDCFQFTEKHQVPVVAVHQAKRAAAERRKKDETAGPVLEDAFGADAISQNATRQFSFMQVENGGVLTNTKNRYGKRGDAVLYSWQINHGLLVPIVQGNLKDSFS